jgi:signal transduction histidine kinase
VDNSPRPYPEVHVATIAAPAAQAALPGRSSRALAVILAVGGTAGLATALGVGQSDGFHADALSVVRGLVVASYVAVGAYTRWHRPESGFGDLMIAVGLLYVGASLTAGDGSLVHSVGRVAHAVLIVLFAYVFLCFPNDRLRSRLERGLVAGLVVATAAIWIPTMLVREELPPAGPLVDCGDECPSNAFRLLTAPDAVSSALGAGVSAVTAAALIALVVLLARKLRAPGRLRRRLVVPLLASVVVLALNSVVYTVLRPAGVEEFGALTVAGAISALAIPPAILAGQVRGRVFAATSLGLVVGRVGQGPVTPARVEELLRDALGDPLLALVLREEGRAGFVDVQGREVELPVHGRDVHVTTVLRNGRPVAALVHDPAIDDDSGVVEGLARTSLLLLENAQLIDDLRASRARIVAATHRERLRLERNLHDGAQQRLFALQLKLNALRTQAGSEQLDDDLAEIAEDAAAAAAELREVAHGLYPANLRERGIVGALRSVARTATIPVRIDDRGIERYTEAVEEAVYYTALEAIQNASKHAGEGARVSVTLERAGAQLELTVADDGVGFDSEEQLAGMGLYSMRDRIGAVGGEVSIASRPGAGTTVRVFVPVPADAAA